MNLTSGMQPYTPTHVIAVMMSKPVLTTAEDCDMLQFMLERSAIRIEGLNNNLVRQDGPKDRSHPMDVFVHEQLKPSFVFVEYEGRMIERFAIDVLTLAGDFDVMFIEPAPDQKSVQAAWLCSSMKINRFYSIPSGRNVAGFPLKNGNPNIECTIEFSCKTNRDDVTLKMANDMLAQMNVVARSTGIRKFRFPS